MEIRAVSGLNAFASRGNGVHAHLFFHGPSPHVYCDFGPDRDEPDPEGLLGGEGRFVIHEEDGSHIEVFGSVRDLVPILQEVTKRFEERLKELPND